MDEGTVRQFAECQAILAEIESIKIEVEGMKVANAERLANGYSLAYGEDVFNDMAKLVLNASVRLKTEI